MGIIRGALGDCWLTSAVATLTIHPDLLERVIPNPQKQDYVNPNRDCLKRGGVYRGYHRSPKNHPGIFRFRFYRFGEWVEVVVDDYLPCGLDDPNEFWVSLLEKAYAKLNGCYEALDAGSATTAFVDLSGNIPEHINIREFAQQKYIKHTK
ncbi:Calpain-2 catalytic subunit [Nowakowskiella sp. JEL0078]|nr:Calpain-2 catalytic subunit [Nowakowskiella sp. JEL0078]